MGFFVLVTNCYVSTNSFTSIGTTSQIRFSYRSDFLRSFFLLEMANHMLFHQLPSPSVVISNKFSKDSFNLLTFFSTPHNSSFAIRLTPSALFFIPRKENCTEKFSFFFINKPINFILDAFGYRFNQKTHSRFEISIDE